MRPAPSRRKLYVSLLKLTLIVAGILGGFHLLFEVAPSKRTEIRAAALSVLPGLKQPRDPDPRIIFRLDDVEKGVREQQVFDLLALFQRRDVPLDLGLPGGARSGLPDTKLAMADRRAPRDASSRFRVKPRFARPLPATRRRRRCCVGLEVPAMGRVSAAFQPVVLGPGIAGYTGSRRCVSASHRLRRRARPRRP